MATDPNEIQLTEEQRELLAKRAEETGRDPSELLDEFFATLKQPKRPVRGDRSLFDVLNDRGLIGVMEGPGDLSTNPKHMEGFGESRGGPDTA